MKKYYRAKLAFIVCVFSFLACQNTVNESIHISDGETTSGDMNSVNGGIVIGKNCIIKGTARTVNGPISVGKKSRVEGLQSVNGSIELQTGVHVRDDIGSVNGPVTCGPDVEISGEIGTVNGAIFLEGTSVGRNIETVSGEIALRSGSRIRGDIIVDAEDNNSDDRETLFIRIEDGSVVEGDVLIKRHHRPVEVHLSGGGKVLGEIKGAKVVENSSI